jgi:hypothetical protein
MNEAADMRIVVMNGNMYTSTLSLHILSPAQGWLPARFWSAEKVMAISLLHIANQLWHLGRDQRVQGTLVHQRISHIESSRNITATPIQREPQACFADRSVEMKQNSNSEISYGVETD